MDCNNYSYSNSGSTCRIIAECEKGLSGFPVFWECVLDWFGDWCFIVSDPVGDAFAEFPFCSWKPWTEKEAREKARCFYNDLVPASECVPFF